MLSNTVSIHPPKALHGGHSDAHFTSEEAKAIVNDCSGHRAQEEQSVTARCLSPPAFREMALRAAPSVSGPQTARWWLCYAHGTCLHLAHACTWHMPAHGTCRHMQIPIGHASLPSGFLQTEPPHGQPTVLILPLCVSMDNANN